MITITLFDYIQSELIEQGFDEFVNDAGELVLFDDDYQFTTKIMKYDEDVQKIVDWLFNGLSLKHREHDEHFKKMFLYRFVNRQINRQTIEAFKLELMNTFITNELHLNQLYADAEKYITNTSTMKQKNKQMNEGTTTSDNRQAFGELPQNNINIDVDDTVLTGASDNTISRNKQSNNQLSDGETTSESKSYQLDQLLQSSTLFENVMNIFDQRCFLQIW